MRKAIKLFQAMALTAILSMGAGAARAADIVDAVQAHRDGNYVLALDLFRELALNGDASAQFWVGDMYAKGEGVRQDFKQAFSWYMKAAAHDEPRAQFAVAEAYDQGRGVDHDGKRAATWYLTAAENGNARAAFTVGLNYAKGTDMPLDLVQAHKWLSRAGDIAAGTRAWVEEKMSASQIQKARALEAEWSERYN